MSIFSLPLKKMPNVNRDELFTGVQKLGFLRSWIYYVVDRNYRKSVSVRDWYVDWIAKGEFVAPQFDANLSQKDKCLLALAWVKSQVTYTGDTEQWGVIEKWSLPTETLATRKGDCEDGAILLAEVLRQNGIPSNQLYIVAGDVVGGGHCYVVWVSDDDLLEYALDWCYWSRDSLVKPYALNANYFKGSREWFRFNWDGSYVKK